MVGNKYERYIVQLLFVAPPNSKIDYSSISLLSGHACPFALDCMAKVHKVTRKIVDGKYATVRCHAASSEASFPSVYDTRDSNFNLLKACETEDEMVLLIQYSLPNSYSPFRIHVGGDFFNQRYFNAWVRVAREDKFQRIFYGYTKSLRYWVNCPYDIPDNLSLTASEGGREDFLIRKHNLKSAIVVDHPDEAIKLGLQIDHDDSLAIKSKHSFALLLHGVQKAGTKSSKALQRMTKENIQYSYSKR